MPKMNRSTFEVRVKRDISKNFTKAIASYVPGANGDDTYELSLNKLILKQPDLLYVTSRMASQGANRNNEVFLRKIMVNSWQTPRHKFVDFEHDPHGTNWVDTDWEGKNPDKYHIVGHIWNSALAEQEDGVLIPEEDIFICKDGKAFQKDSIWRDKKIDLLCSWVLYKWEFEELAELVENEFDNGPNDSFGVSMEVLYSDYKFVVGEVDPDEDFYDKAPNGRLEAKKGSPLAKILEQYWKKKEKYNNKIVYRVLGGDVIFSGLGIVRRRGEERSINLSVAALSKNYLNRATASERGIDSLIMSVASADNSGISSCSLEEDGLPSCGCLDKSMDDTINILKKTIENFSYALEKTVAITKREDVNPKSGKKKYGDVKFADSKNKKYPIDTEEHIRAAWNYINQARNAAKYQSKDVKTIKSKILSAWKRKIDKSGPPSASKSGLDIGCPYCYDDEEDTNNPEHIDYHINQAKTNTEQANKILQNLYENNIDNELTKEEIMEYLEEIEHVFGETESFFKKNEK